MSGGRPTYTNADALYGAAKPSISGTIASTPATADPTKPVMVKPQSMEERRADYQTRANNEISAQNAPRAIPVIQPTPERQIGNTGSRSLQETSRMADAAKTARESGKMGDYFTSQGKAEMAKAFPNKTEDPKGLKLGQRKPLTTLAGVPLRAIPVNSRA